MRVAIYLVDSIDPSLGGNFAYYDKFIAAVDARKFGEDVEICFVGRLPKDQIKLQKPYVRLSSRFYFLFFKALNKSGITGLLSMLLRGSADHCARADGRILREHGIDLVVFPKQFLMEVNEFPFVTMNWDAGHKTTYAFPELLENFNSREKWYQLGMQKALSIFVESESGRDELYTHYGIPKLKMRVVPLFAGGVIDMKVDTNEQKEILSKHGLEVREYFYYPAQFWAHKNHVALIEAFQLLKRKSGFEKTKLVFSGSDKGNKQYIVDKIKEAGLSEDILVMGFISNEMVYTLYCHARALVMATYLGPTNMPLLEAQALGTSVICSDLSGHRETNKEGAIYVDPGDVSGWCDAMQRVSDPVFRDQLIAKGNEVLRSSPFRVSVALEAFESSLRSVGAVRKTFR